MFELHYQPANAWFGDCMPFYRDGQFYLFHQRDTRRPSPFGEPFGWALARTSDFVHYEDLGEVLPRGSDDDQDQFVFAGSVFAAGGTFYAMYTGYNRTFAARGRPSQVLLLATSTDLVHWTKTERQVVLPQPGYDPDDWRDPYVLWDESRKRYLLILGAHALDGTKNLTGRTVYFTSTDLENWHFGGDFWAPGLYSMHEMPDLFRIGEYWYLLTTEYSHRSKTVYRMSTSLDGPWTAPVDDAFDGRAYYAARSASDGSRRYLFGWVPTKEGDDDRGDWQWGGTLLVHELFQRDDGSLGVRTPGTVEPAFGPGVLLRQDPLVLTASDAVAENFLAESTTDSFRFEATIRFTPGTRKIGVRLFEDRASGTGYEFAIRPGEHLLTFDRRGTYRWNTYNDKGLRRPLDLAADTDHLVQVVVDDTIATLYVAGVALTARMYAKAGTALAVDAVDGRLDLRNATLQAIRAG